MKIELSPKAKRNLQKLRKNQSLLKRLHNAILELMIEPVKGKDLEGNFAGILSLRVGDWRVLYEIHSEEQSIVIIRIGHRKEVYR